MQMRVGLDDYRGHGVSSGGLVLGEQDDLVRARARVRVRARTVRARVRTS